ncbi:MAG: hypothetical protein N3F03_07390 [Ignavibacteria bacterium]|nr:hypothetical protein [Ignavibacteria bacterium]
MEILKVKTKIILPIFIGLLFISCSEKAKDIFNPTADNLIEFSLSQRTYKMEDVVKRQSQIRVDSGKYLLKFSTEEIRKDTTIDAFNADFFEMNVDTLFYVIISDTIDAQMIIRRDSVGIQEAEIESGYMTLRFINYTNKPSFFELTLPGFTKRVGSTKDTLRIGGQIPPNQTVVFQRDLSNFLYAQPTNQPFGTTRPGFWLRGKIYLQGGTFGDSVRVLTNVSDIKFRRIKGRFKPFELGVKQQTIKNLLSEDISEFIHRVTFDSISVRMNSFTTIDLPIRLKQFRVRGIFKSGRAPITLMFGDKDYLDTMIQKNSNVSLNFSNVNTNINQFLSQIPDSINISTTLILNPDYQSGEIVSNDSISFSFQVDAWSRFAVNEADWTDTFDIDLSQDVRKKLKNAKDGKVIIYSTNQVPMEVNLIGLVTDSLYNPLFYLTKDEVARNDTMVVLQGAITNTKGEVLAPAYQTIVINLNQSEIEKLSRGYKLLQRFMLSTTEKRVAEVSAKSKIDLRITGRLIIKLTSDDFKN